MTQQLRNRLNGYAIGEGYSGGKGMAGNMNKSLKNEQKQNDADKTQSVYNEPVCLILSPREKTEKNKISQYFSYQIVSRAVTGTQIGNGVQINEV
jgi:hypothetical protein